MPSWRRLLSSMTRSNSVPKMDGSMSDQVEDVQLLEHCYVVRYQGGHEVIVEQAAIEIRHFPA